MKQYKRNITRAPDFYIKFTGYLDAKKRLVHIEGNRPRSPYITRLEERFAVINKKLELAFLKKRHPIELEIAEKEDELEMVTALSEEDNPNGARAAAEETALNAQLVQLRTALSQLDEVKLAEMQIYATVLNHICATYNLGAMLVIKPAAPDKEEHKR